MNVGANGKMVVALTKQLSVAWAETQTFWNDKKSEEFEKRFLQELTATVERAAPVFDQLDKLITRIRSECE